MAGLALVGRTFQASAACQVGASVNFELLSNSLTFEVERNFRGGCHISVASIERLYRLHLHLGTASHIYMR